MTSFVEQSRLTFALDHLELFWAKYCELSGLPAHKPIDAAYDNDLTTEQRAIAAMVYQIKAIAAPDFHDCGGVAQLSAQVAADLAERE